MSAAACKEELCQSKSHQMTRAGTLLRGAVDAFAKPANRRAFADAGDELQGAIIGTFDEHVRLQLELDANCLEIFETRLEELRESADD